MISLELSMVQHNRSKSAELAAAMAGFERQGGVIQVLEIRRHALPVFNSESIAPSARYGRQVKVGKSEKVIDVERAIAEKLRAYIDTGVAAAAKALGMSTRRLNFIAAEYGIVFKTASHESSIHKKRLAEIGMAPVVRQMFSDGKTQMDVIRTLGITKDRLRRMAQDHKIDLPGFTDATEDLKLIERITAIRDIGCTRAQCCRQLDISRNKLLRLIADHEVDYPLARS